MELPAKQHCQFGPFTKKSGKRAELAVLFSWLLQNGPQDFDFHLPWVQITQLT